MVGGFTKYMRGTSDCQRVFHAAESNATFDENSVPPWTRGTSEGFCSVTDHLVWVLDPEPHPGAAVKASQAFTPSQGGGFQRFLRAEFGCRKLTARPRSSSMRLKELGGPKTDHSQGCIDPKRKGFQELDRILSTARA
jgi:hypothetical protein